MASRIRNAIAKTLRWLLTPAQRGGWQGRELVPYRQLTLPPNVRTGVAKSKVSQSDALLLGVLAEARTLTIGRLDVVKAMGCPQWTGSKTVVELVAAMRETLRQVSVQPCIPSLHDDGSVCSPCHARSYFEMESDMLNKAYEK